MDKAIVSGWLSFAQDGTVEVRVGKVELGQGISTALAQIAADSLGVAFDRVRMAEVVTGRSPNEGFTSGSRSIMDSGASLARACGQARAALLAEAGRRSGQQVEALRVDDGRISGPDGAPLGDFWELAGPGLLDVPIDLSAPAGPPPARGNVGAPVARLDLPGKFAGRPSFVHDMALPGQLFGRVVRPPAPGARLLEAPNPPNQPDPPDGSTVVRHGSFLGVVAEREEDAIRAARLLSEAARWSEGSRLPDEAAVPAGLADRPTEQTEVVRREGPRKAVRTVRMRYTRPYIAHASIGPSAAVAVWHGGTATVWTHTQGVYPLRAALAEVCGLAEDAVEVHHVPGAGCYGHNGADDAALDALLLARAVPGHPVQVVLSRADEFAWEPYGPPMLAEVEAGLDTDGRVVRWRHDVWSYGHQTRPGYGGHHGLLGGWLAADVTEFPPANDPPLAGGGGTARNAAPLYDFPNQAVTAHRVLEMPLRTSSLRALGATLNVFAIESAMDELAGEAGVDPLEYRLRHLSDHRARGVLELVAERAGWSTRRSGSGTGIAFARYKNTCAYCAVVAEVEAEAEVRVRRLVLAVDAGCIVNPDGLVNQIEGGAVQATSMALLEAVHFDGRTVTSRDWEGYPILRFSQVPDVQVHLANSPELPPLGVGECAQGPVAAAIANALADGLGLRVRDLPLTRERVVAAMDS